MEKSNPYLPHAEREKSDSIATGTLNIPLYTEEIERVIDVSSDEEGGMPPVRTKDEPKT